MNKSSDILWLGIRGVGVFFLVKAILIAFALPGLTSRAISTTRMAHRMVAQTLDGSGMDMPTMFGYDPDTLAKISRMMLVEAAVSFVGFGLLGVYLTRFGKLVHRFLRFPSEDAPKTPELSES
jgi:hypothetical protein